MTPGERRVASRLESFLNDDCLVWYDIPVGRKNRHPDFVIIDPENGLVFLEVKDWTVSTLREVNQEQVTLETDGLLKSEIRWYRFVVMPVIRLIPYLQTRAYGRMTVSIRDG
mgnify:CR=1 FL=1